MPSYVSATEDLVLHAPRVVGFASTARVAARYGLDHAVTAELLLDFEAHGWVRRASYADSPGWYLTELGRTENERRMSTELDRAGARPTVTRLHREFLPLNGQLGAACTDWQLRPTRVDSLAVNDHTDLRWDDRVIDTLTRLGDDLARWDRELTSCLQRFAGYGDRYSSALTKVAAGQGRWVDSPELDSCHTVWIQFHEDLLATLGIPRGADGT